MKRVGDSTVLFVAGLAAIAAVATGIVVGILRVEHAIDLLYNARFTASLWLPIALVTVAAVGVSGYALVVRCWVPEMSGAIAISLVGLVAPFSLALVGLVLGLSAAGYRRRNPRR